MKMKSLSLLVLPLLLALGGTGCQSLFGNDPGSGGTSTGADAYPDDYYADLELDLNSANGGYTTQDEAPNFGDPEFLRRFNEQPHAADGMAGHPVFGGSLAEKRVYIVRILWGQLAGSDEAVPTRWDGTLSVDRGGIMALRLIDFERPGDHLLTPRQDPLILGLASATSTGHDGLLVKIVDHQPDSQEPNALHIELGAVRHDIPVSALTDYAERIVVDDRGNEMLIESPTEQDCPYGFLSGLWISRNIDPRGVFRGAVLDPEGFFIGHLRGHWGVDSSGARVFAGKMISLSGGFRGIVRGNWEPDAEGSFNGSFDGGWSDGAGDRQGELYGNYWQSWNHRGFFSGRWAELCP